MKFLITLTIIVAIFALSADAGKKRRCGALVKANCDDKNYQSCPAINPICGYKQVLLQDNSGCCCHGKCAANEAYGCACSDKVCNQPDKICIQCLNGCYCAEGYVRDVEGGKCIKAEECPAPRCEGEEVYTCKCAESVCNQPDKNCIICENGCYCAEGYVRDVEGGKCIKKDSCPKGGSSASASVAFIAIEV